MASIPFSECYHKGDYALEHKHRSTHVLLLLACKDIEGKPRHGCLSFMKGFNRFDIADFALPYNFFSHHLQSKQVSISGIWL